MEYFKNPIFLGILAGIIAYLYMYWSKNKSIKDSSDNKEQEDDNNAMIFVIPIMIGAVAWFASSMYFSQNNMSLDNEQIVNNGTDIKGGECHTLLNNKVRLPESDVFIDIMPF